MMLHDAIASIRPPCADTLARAKERQARLTKPAGSLGRLEDLAERICAARRTLEPILLRKAAIVFAADHGVVAEGVSAYPQAVTAQMVLNFLAGGAAVSALARSVGARLVVVDVGVAAELPFADGLLARKIAYGTRNFAREPAMTREQAMRSIEIGIEVATSVAKDADAIALGEMGIGNTTAASAVTIALFEAPAQAVTGRGTGIDDATLAKKIAVVSGAIARHAPKRTDPIGVLAAVGGFEIGAIAGACIGAAAMGSIAVIDGFISTAGAALAAAIAPQVVGYLVAGTRSVEPGHGPVLEELLGLRPILDLGLRLGEASGAVLALPVIDGALAAFREMATFESAGVSDRSDRSDRGAAGGGGADRT